jgi:hypothetical protein
MSKRTCVLRAMSPIALATCLLAAGIVVLVAAPRPFVQYSFAEGEECSPDQPCSGDEECVGGVCVARVCPEGESAANDHCKGTCPVAKPNCNIARNNTCLCEPSP